VIEVPVKVGWWVRLNNGAEGQVVWVADHGQPGIRVQVTAAGRTLSAHKCSVAERINPYHFSEPVGRMRGPGKFRDSDDSGTTYNDSNGIHLADWEDA
jgi:hypothetical protein